MKNFKLSLGKIIQNLRIEEDILILDFKKYKVTIQDEAQSCCENRYMHTDDNLANYVGAKLLGIDIKNIDITEDTNEVHEIQFVEIQTSKGCFTILNHNEHNGYYGGFNVNIKESLK